MAHCWRRAWELRPGKEEAPRKTEEELEEGERESRLLLA